MSSPNPGLSPDPSGVSRRTVVKGAAWTVPAVAVASAVPAQAASPTGNNLAVSVSDCSLVTIRVGGENPGFTYTVTEGTIPAGTQITITSGGTVALSAGNFVFDGLQLNLLGLGNGVATFETLQDMTVGQSIRIGLTGFTLNVIGTYTTNILTADDVQTDDIGIMNTGGVGLGSLGVFICFDAAGGGEEVPDLDFDVIVDYGWCATVGLGPAASFEIDASGGTIPAGTRFLLYSSAPLSLGIGNWTTGGGTALSLDLLGTGTQVAEFETPRDIAPGDPLTVEYQGIQLNVASTFYLAYLGNDNDPANNATGMKVTGVTVPIIGTVANCERLTA